MRARHCAISRPRARGASAAIGSVLVLAVLLGAALWTPPIHPEARANSVGFGPQPSETEQVRSGAVREAPGAGPMGLARMEPPPALFAPPPGSNGSGSPYVNDTLDLWNNSVVPGNFVLQEDVYPLALAYDGPANLILVADEASSNILLISGSNGSLVGEIFLPAMSARVAMEFDPANDLLWVADAPAGEVSLVNLSNDSYVQSVRVGSDPTALVDAVGAREVFVANDLSGNLSVLNDTTGALVGTISGFVDPYAEAYDPAQNLVFVGSGSVGIISVVSASNWTILTNISVPNALGALAFDPALDELFAPSGGYTFENQTATYANMSVVSVANDSVVGVVPLSNWTQAIGYDNQTGALYLAQPEGDSVTVIDAASRVVQSTVTVGAQPSDLTVDGSADRVFVLNQYSYDIVVLSDTTDLVTDAFPLFHEPIGDAFDPATGDLYVADTAADRLYVISSATDQIVTSVLVGIYPIGVALDVPTGQVFVCNFLSDTVSVFNVTTDTVVATLPVRPNPFAAVDDPTDGRVFVTASNSANVTIIDTSNDTVAGSLWVPNQPIALAYDSASNLLFVGGRLLGLGIPDGARARGSYAAFEPLCAFNATTGVEVWCLSVGSAELPFMAVDPGDGLLYVNTGLSGGTSSPTTEVDVIDAGNGTVRTTVLLPNSVESLAYDSGTDLLIATAQNFSLGRVYGEVEFVAPVSGQLLDTLTVGDEPFGIAANTATRTLFLTESSGGTVSFVQEGNLTAPASFPVTLFETGLPAAMSWEARVGSATWWSSADSLQLELSNGSYIVQFESCGASGCPGPYDPRPGEIDLTVAGSPQAANLTFYLPEYTYHFSETGLPPGSTWSVVLNGTLASSISTGIAFTEPNGTYAYTVTSGNPEYRTATPSGNVTITGPGGGRTFRFGEVVYEVSFTESGLYPGTEWQVDLDGNNLSGSATTLTVFEPNGSYEFTAGPVAGFDLVYNGSFDVHGGPVGVNVRYEPLFLITFQESGLPDGTGWNVTLGSQGASGNGSALTFREPDGAYSFSVGSVPNFTRTPANGNLSVNGGPIFVNIVFSPRLPMYFAVTFLEQGLPNGTSWSVTLAGFPHTSTGVNITFTEPNGTYAYAVANVTGFSSSVLRGSVNLTGAPVAQLVVFTRAAGGSASGSAWELDAAVVVLVLAVVVGVVLWMWRRTKPLPPATERGPSGPPSDEPPVPSRDSPNAEYWNQPPREP